MAEESNRIRPSGRHRCAHTDTDTTQPDAQSNHDCVFGFVHFVVILRRSVKNSIAPSPVISQSPNLLAFMPPNENGSRGTGTPMLTPSLIYQMS